MPGDDGVAAVVRLDGVSKSYGGRTVLDDVSFSVARGQVVGLLGRNGAGKTTTLKIMLGLVAPDSGTVSVLGRTDVAALAPTSIGVSMDSMGQVPGSTVRRELSIWAASVGVGQDRVREVVELVGLRGHERQRCARLSTGQRQRLSLATALLSPAVELLVLDEPTNALDPDGIRWMRRLVRSFADAGTTVLLSSHTLAEVEQVVDDVLLLDTRLRHAGPLDRLTNGGERSLEDSFFEIVGER